MSIPETENTEELSQRKPLKSNVKVTARDKYKEFDEIKLYFEISKIDKSQSEQYKNPKKWYFEKRKNALEIIQNFSKKYEFSKHTLYASIKYSDLILGFNEEINEKDFDLTVIACCLLSSKFIENDAFDINLNELIALSDNEITIEEIYENEIKVCEKLNYYLEIPNVYDFIQFLNLIGVFYQGEIKNANRISEDIQFFTRKVIFSEIALKFPNEIIAMCIIRAVRKKNNLSEDVLIKKIFPRYKFNYNDIFEECYNEVLFFIFGEKKENVEKKSSLKKRISKDIDNKNDQSKNENNNNENINNENNNNENNNKENNNNENIRNDIRNSTKKRTARGSMIFDYTPKNTDLKLNYSSSSSSSKFSFSHSSSSDSESESNSSDSDSENEKKKEISEKDNSIDDNLDKEKNENNEENENENKTTKKKLDNNNENKINENNTKNINDNIKENINEKKKENINENNKENINEEKKKMENSHKKKKKKGSVHFKEDTKIVFEGRKSTSVRLKTIIGHKEKQRHIKAINEDKINFPFVEHNFNHSKVNSPIQERNLDNNIVDNNSKENNVNQNENNENNVKQNENNVNQNVNDENNLNHNQNNEKIINKINNHHINIPNKKNIINNNTNKNYINIINMKKFNINQNNNNGSNNTHKRTSFNNLNKNMNLYPNNDEKDFNCTYKSSINHKINHNNNIKIDLNPNKHIIINNPIKFNNLNNVHNQNNHLKINHHSEKINLTNKRNNNRYMNHNVQNHLNKQNTNLISVECMNFFHNNNGRNNNSNIFKRISFSNTKNKCNRNRMSQLNDITKINSFKDLNFNKINNNNNSKNQKSKSIKNSKFRNEKIKLRFSVHVVTFPSID